MTAAITVDNIGKRYRLGLPRKKSQTLKDLLRSAACAPFRYLRYRLQEPTDDEILWALRNVSFEVQQGEVLGVIGRNGAGKSTLLKILSRITDPTEGRAVIRGRVNSLLEVGTGFHQELTGLENIFMSAALHGMKQAEIKRSLDEIIAFAEVEKFIDTPVKRYSSGMYTRLAFAVAAHLEPEILIVDEVLAVGDMEFQKKCLGKMDDVARAGRTVLFVSHQMPMINKLCSRCILLEAGRVRCDDQTSRVVEQYLMQPNSAHGCTVRFEGRAEQPIFIREMSMLNPAGLPSSTIRYQESCTLRMHIVIRQSNPRYYVTVRLMNAQAETLVFTADDDLQPSALAEAGPGEFIYEVRFPARLLKPGAYALTVNICEPVPRGKSKVYDGHERELVFNIEDLDSRRAQRNAYRPFASVAPEVEWVRWDANGVVEEESR